MAGITQQPPLNAERDSLAYIKFFELGDNPFTTSPNPMYAYANGALVEGLKQMRNVAIGRTGLGLVDGEVGIGKSTLAMTTANDLQTRGVAVAMFPRMPGNTRQTEASVMAEIASRFGLKSQNGNSALGHYNAIADFAQQQDLRKGNVAVIIDDAQYLRPNAVKCLLQLLAIQTMKAQLVQILLFGQSPEIIEVVKSNRALHSRLAGAIHLEPFTALEVAEMIAYRLRVATTTRAQPIFEPAAIDRVASISRGIPRLVCRIAHYACIDAANERAAQVRTVHIDRAAQRLRHAGEF